MGHSVAEEARRLFERLAAQRGTFLRPSRDVKGPFSSRNEVMFRASLGRGRTHTKQMRRGRVDLDPDTVHAAHHHIVEAAPKMPLIDIVLVLADAD